MDVQRKNIQTLTELLDDKRNELTDLYRLFGEKLLKEAVSSDDLALLLGRERVDSWKSLMDSRENDTRAILEVKDVLARSQELKQFHQEIDRNRSDLDDDYRSVLEKLGYACYERSTQGGSEFFTDIKDKAAADGTELIKLEEKRDALQEELQSAGMMQRMMLQVKIAANDNAVKQCRERMMKKLGDEAQRLFENGVLEKRLEAGELDEQFGLIIASLRETRGKQQDLENRKDSLQSEKKALDDMLISYGAKDNPGRRIDELHAGIRDTDRRITTLSVMTAREYCDVRMDEDGVRIDSGEDLPAERNQLIEKVAALRSEIINTRKSIEILEADVKIAAMDRTLANIDRSREEFEKKIKQYQDQISRMEQNRAEVVSERASLEEYRDSIQKTLS